MTFWFLSLVFIVGMLIWAYMVHRRERNSLGLFYFSILCFCVWVATVWALRSNDSWWWAFLILPLNTAWMFGLPWPIISRYWPFNRIERWIIVLLKHWRTA